MKFNRRNVLIGLGSIAAGAGTLAGTGAFTSVTANRNADIRVAGDADALLGVVPVRNSENSAYVSQSDGTVSLDLDGDSSASATGVNNDAVTQIENLFKVINQGTQSVNFYFEDDSDAVTFRVSESTETATSGTAGQSLEGAGNSISLDVGDEVVVGLTIDTLNNYVSGKLLDEITLVADSNASAPEQSGPTPQYVVDGTGDAPNTFATLSGALSDPGLGSGAVVGIEGGVSIVESQQITVDQPITIVGIGGTPTLDMTGFSDDGGAIDITADDVTLRNFALMYSDGDGGAATNGIEVRAGSTVSGLTVDGLLVSNQGTYTGQPAINTEAANGITITNNEVSGGAIGVYYPSGATAGSETVSGNYVNANPGGSGGVTEGIFVYGDGLPSKDLGVRNNKVDNHGSSSREIKLGQASKPDVTPASVNSQAALDHQFDSLLGENDVNTVQIGAGDGVTVDPDADETNVYADIATGISEAGQSGFVNIVSGRYTESLTIAQDVTLWGANNGRPGPNRSASDLSGETIIESPNAPAITVSDNADLTVNGLSLDNVQYFLEGDQGTGWGDLTLENTIFTNASSETGGNFWLKGNAGSLTFRNNFLTGNDISNGLRVRVYSGGPANIQISDNLWENNRAWAMNLNSVHGTIENNIFRNTPGFNPDPVSGYDYKHWGILVADENNDLTIQDNVFNNLTGPGVDMYGSTFGTVNIENNTFTDISNDAVELSSTQAPDPYPADEITIKINGNTFSNNDLAVNNEIPDKKTIDATGNGLTQDDVSDGVNI